MILSFGKYRGRDIGTVPSDYLQWVLDNVAWLKWSQRRAIEDELARRVRYDREQDDRATPPPLLALPERASLDVARELIAAGRRRMAQEAHPDVGGSNDLMTTINCTADWLIELIERIAS